MHLDMVNQELIYLCGIIMILSNAAFKLSSMSSSTNALAIQRVALDGWIGEVATPDNVWWTKDELKFDCTGCGKCCVNDGEVWMDIDEFVDLIELLQDTSTAIYDKYVDAAMDGWVKLKNKIPTTDNPSLLDRCIFLGEDEKTCGIYTVRPAQCRTYPYWPRLLLNREAWDKEAVVPEESTRQGRNWSYDDGGCEGMEHADARVVPVKTIYRNSELYNQYNDGFPLSMMGDDRIRILAKADLIMNVNKATKSWVKQFVIGYGLCPFAEAVFTAGSIRYRVYTGSERELIISKIRYEILHLLTTSEKECSTTLLTLPLAFGNFEEFHKFQLELQDEIIPSIENETLGPTDSRDKDDVPPDIEIAAFHPLYQWEGTEINDPLNYEKRAPFPTINLLRAAHIRESTNEIKTAKISENNIENLKDIGSSRLKKEFENLLKLAI